MKKYRNSIMILLVTLLSLSVFYVNLAFSSSDLPEFYFKQTSGDPKLLDNLIIDASYEDSVFTEEAEITKEGSDYLSELSFFDQLDYRDKKKDTVDMKNLTEQFPFFMRGKTENKQLYNDTNTVIYVNSNYDFSSSQGMYNFRLAIDQLDKKTEDSNSFEVEIPNQEQSEFIEILDVQVIMDELRVVTLSENMDEPKMLHEYTFNLKKEKLIDDNSIIKTEEENDKQSFYITNLTDINPTQSNTNFIFELDKMIIDETGENSQTVSRDLYAYNYKTGKLNKLKLPAELTKQLLQDAIYDLSYDNSSLYTFTIKDDSKNKTINMVKYDLENQNITKDHTILLESTSYEHHIGLYQNKLIITYKGENKQPFIKIYNSEDGKSLLEGTIDIKNNQKVDYEDFYIYQVNGL